MRRLLPILLIVLFVVPLTTTYFVLHQQKKSVRRQVKRAMMAGIDRSELVHFKFSKQVAADQLTWEHAKEFEFQGQMYDVVHTSLSKDSVEYWCWWDHEETALNQRLARLVARALSTDTERQDFQRRLGDFLKTLICDQPQAFAFYAPASRKQFPSQIELTASMEFPPTSPPPDYRA